MRIHKQQTDMIQVHACRHACILFQFLPCAFHLGGVMDIIDDQHSFLRQTRQQIPRIALGRLIRMVGIDIDDIQPRTRVII